MTQLPHDLTLPVPSDHERDVTSVLPATLEDQSMLFTELYFFLLNKFDKNK